MSMDYTDYNTDIIDRTDLLVGQDDIGGAGDLIAVGDAAQAENDIYTNSDLNAIIDMYNDSRDMMQEQSYEVVQTESDDCTDITSANIPETLDEIEQQIDRLKLRWSEVTYLIGQRLKYISDHRLYEQKGYHDFKTYVTLALKMSENNAYYYISVFEYFTEEQTKRAGSKLKLIIPVLNKLKRDKSVSDELKAIKIKGMRDELYYKIYNKTYREAEKIITDMRQKYFTDVQTFVSFRRIKLTKNKIIINESDPDIQQKLVALIEEFYG